MEVPSTKVKHELPTVAELQQDFQTAFQNDKLNIICHQPPPIKWLKNHPMIPKHKYLPIDKVEYLLTRVFGKWRREVKSIGIMGNSVVCHLRLHVWNPITLEWDWQDGVGAAPIQLNSGATPGDITQMKNNAMQLAAPTAESYAFKDAAECFGPLFGKDLNKDDVMFFNGTLQNFTTPSSSSNGSPTISVEAKQELEIETPF